MFEFLAYFTIGLIALVVPTILAIATGRFLMRQMSNFPLEGPMDLYMFPLVFGGGILLIVPLIAMLIAMVGQASLQALVGIPS